MNRMIRQRMRRDARELADEFWAILWAHLDGEPIGPLASCRGELAGKLSSAGSRALAAAYLRWMRKDFKDIHTWDGEA